LIDELSEHNIIHGLNLSGPSYNVDQSVNLDFNRVNDGDILDMVWSTSESSNQEKKEDKTNQNTLNKNDDNHLEEEITKMQNRTLKVSW